MNKTNVTDNRIKQLSKELKESSKNNKQEDKVEVNNTKKEKGKFVSTLMNYRLFVAMTSYILFCAMSLPVQTVYLVLGEELAKLVILPVSILSYIFVLGLVAYLYYDEIVHAMKGFKKHWLKILTIPLFHFSLILCNALIGLFIYQGQTSNNQKVAVSIVSENSPLYAILVMGLIVPVIEELIFREGIIKAFKGSKHWGYGISAVVFIGIHVLTDPKAFLIYVPLTVMMIFMYKWTEDNVLYSILLHMYNNMFAVGMIYLIPILIERLPKDSLPMLQDMVGQVVIKLFG